MDKERIALRSLGAAVAAAVCLGGCAAPAWRSTPPAPPYPQAPSAAPRLPAQPPPTAIPPLERRNRLSPASSALVRQARLLERRGDLDGASATLDRALRIEANNPHLWIELGRLRLAEHDAPQAANCARKALALASGDQDAHARAGQLLAQALRAGAVQPPHPR
ncbi:MAG: tetratricopeptide repeat protein [Gammaproteobacteria bacterium]|nr:tetratricopeptide repeat protein [Gammaproteobacteria bacterium]